MRQSNPVFQAGERWAKCSSYWTAEQTLNTVKRSANDWYDNECRWAVEEKNSTCLKMKQRDTRATREQYRKKRRVDNKIIRRKKQDCQENWLKKMEEERKKKKCKDSTKE